MPDEQFRYGKLLQVYTRWMLVVLAMYGLYAVPFVGALRFRVEWAVAGVVRGTAVIITTISVPVTMARFWWEGSGRVADLEDRLAKTAVDRVELERLRREREVLTKVLGLGGNSRLAGGFLGNFVQGSDVGLVSFNRGTAGIVPGMIAVDEAGVFLGKVESVGGYLVTLTVPGQKDTRIGVRVLGSATTGLLIGEGVGVKVAEVLAEEQLEVGDILVTSGAEGIFPEGLVVGQVTEIERQPSDVTYGGTVELLGNFDGLAFILPESEKTP